jgi:MraZ protein
MEMTNFLGEFECKLDTKLRITLPSALKKQLSPQANNRFVINRGFEKHLVLYPYHEWEKVTAEFSRLNLYIKKNREFVRYFHRGATELTLDNSGRLLLPKRLLAYAGIHESVVLLAYANRIECWDSELYEASLAHEPEDFARLAEAIMGSSPASQEPIDTASELLDLPPFLPGQRH